MYHEIKMLEKINLFPKIKAFWEKRVLIRRLVQIISIVGSILYFVILSSLLSYFLLLSREEKSVRKNIETYEEKIRSLEPVESKQLLLKAKLEELSKILKIDKKPEEALEDLETISMIGISFSNLNYAEGSLKIEGKASNVLVLDEFVEKLENEGKDRFSRGEFGNIGRAEENTYNFNLSLER